jgi:hypothetical protein
VAFGCFEKRKGIYGKKEEISYRLLCKSKVLRCGDTPSTIVIVFAGRKLLKECPCTTAFPWLF